MEISTKRLVDCRVMPFQRENPCACSPPVFAALPGAAIITGGSGGIGAAIGQLLAARGSNVSLTYRSGRERADAVASTAPESMLSVHADLVDLDSVKAMLNSTLERFGAIHTLIHAAGPFVPQHYLSQISPSTYAEHLEQEAVGFFNVASCALPALREANGSIVAVTTVGVRRYPKRDGLSASPKAAVEALVRGIAAEEGRYGVRANCVCPGILVDGMTEKLVASGEMDEHAVASALSRIPLNRLGRSSEVAEAACFLASPQASYITGQMIDVDGGYAI